jgi:hypothetical protein
MTGCDPNITEGDPHFISKFDVFLPHMFLPFRNFVQFEVLASLRPSHPR